MLCISCLFPVLLSCGTTTSAPSTSLAVNSSTSVVPSSPEWKKCGDIECASISVPFNYASPELGSFTLPLTRLRALDDDLRQGVLLVNPGGPGAPGSSLAQNAAYYFSKDLMTHFDIVGWDPRGTGASTPTFDCGDSYNDFFANERTVASTQKFVDTCKAKNSEIISHMSTVASARDIDAIRIALGEEKISYFGFSYGSTLGATWATLFPNTVQGAVFDAAAAPNTTSAERRLTQAAGFEKQLTVFLAQCSQNSSCAFHNNGKAEQAFDDLLATEATVNATVVLTATASSLYDDSAWEDLAQALKSAQDGNGQPLRDLYNSYYYQDAGYEDSRNVSEASIATICDDEAQRMSTAEVDAQLVSFTRVAPRFGNFFGRDYTCSLWPTKKSAQEQLKISSTAAIVVVGSTNDPVTPLSSSQSMSAALQNSRFISVNSSRHTSYLKNDCATQLVDAFLIRGTLPLKNSRC
ncbi:MAG: alpha/beta hydrolase [Actinobacteria bacterium]|jgi:pimeloyl-ACP methyl ester carboxylesterase|nr:alpha/beta hydrolase [Actinomycetota bacterium]